MERAVSVACKRCGVVKVPTDYSRDRHRPRGRVAVCKVCRSEIQRTIVSFKPYRRESSYRDTAKARGLAYELTREQFMAFWQKPCFYCGSEIATIGLDRVDNSIGYLVDNVVACCATCNGMKSKMTMVDFQRHCERIVAVTLANAGITFRGEF